MSTALVSEQLKFIQFDVSDTIARITLNHAPYNVLTVPMMTEMAQCIESLNGRNDIKAILVSSSQKTFSAGISLEDSKSDRVCQTLEAFNRVFSAIREISKPLIMVVYGPAIGAGRLWRHGHRHASREVRSARSQIGCVPAVRCRHASPTHRSEENLRTNSDRRSSQRRRGIMPRIREQGSSRIGTR